MLKISKINMVDPYADDIEFMIKIDLMLATVS